MSRCVYQMRKRKKIKADSRLFMLSSKPEKTKPSEQGEERGYGKGIRQQLAGRKRETGDVAKKV